MTASPDELSSPMVTYSVAGSIGTATGKRLVVPADVFESNAKPIFAAQQRELPIDLHYGTASQDAVRYSVPAGTSFESVPKASSQRLENSINLTTSTLQPDDGRSATFRRNLNVARYLFSTKEYPGLQAFYGVVATASQDVFVLERGAH